MSRLNRLRQEQLDKLRAYTGDDEVVSSHELRAMYAQEKEPDFKVYTGIPSLDRVTDGSAPGELIVVTGPTKCGKTELCKTITSYICRFPSMAPPLWLSYEVPPRQFLNSFPGGKAPLFYMPKTLHAQNLDWFEERCLESWEKNSTRIVFIDHLHFLVDQFKVKNPSLEIGGIVRRIKRFAVEFSFIVFLNAHLTKVPAGERPRHHHLRDSSFVAQDSDSVWVLWRVRDPDGEIRNKAQLSMEFHRRTGKMEKLIDLHMQDGLLVETDRGRGA